MKTNRRDFLKTAAGAGLVGPLSVETMVTGMLSGMVNKAFAQENGVDPINYVCLWLSEGVERWYFDGAPAPNGTSAHTFGTLHNKIRDRAEASGKNYVNSFEYGLTSEKVNGKVYLPYLWESLLPGISGNVPMKELARNMLTIRGVDTGVGFDAHGNNVAAAEDPFKKAPTMSILPALNHEYNIFAGYNGYPPKFNDSRSAVVVDVANIGRALNSFQTLGTQSTIYNSTSPSQVRGIVDRFIASMANNLSPSKQKFAQSLLKDREAAKQMIDFVTASLADIQAEYDRAVATYAQLLNSVGQNHNEGRALAFFDDQIIPNPGKETSFSTDKRTSMADVFRIGDGEYISAGQWTDLRTSIETSTFQRLARSFATLEVYFKYNLTNSLKLVVNDITGHFDGGWDVHFGGSGYRLYKHSKYYQALATGLIACMERLDQLTDREGKNVGQKTVFHLRSEFDRTPAGNALGSHHNIRGVHETFFSRMISEGPYVIGNASTKNGQIWGKGMDYLKGAPIDYKNIWSTVATIAGLERDRNFPSLVKREGNRLLPLTDECKDVA